MFLVILGIRWIAGCMWDDGLYKAGNILFPSKNITTTFPISVFPLTKGCPFYQWKDVLPTTQACNLWVIFESVIHRILELGKIFKDIQSNSFTFQIRTCSWKALVFCKFTLWARTRPNILNPHPVFLPLLHLLIPFPSTFISQMPNSTNSSFKMSLYLLFSLTTNLV